MWFIKNHIQKKLTAYALFICASNLIEGWIISKFSVTKFDRLLHGAISQKTSSESRFQTVKITQTERHILSEIVTEKMGKFCPHSRFSFFFKLIWQHLCLFTLCIMYRVTIIYLSNCPNNMEHSVWKVLTDIINCTHTQCQDILY